MCGHFSVGDAYEIISIQVPRGIGRLTKSDDSGP